ncbi:MAG: type I-E CRISPR-associated protein Cas7/Cse4/CasC [Chromatiales bacterium]|nr:type I-E CRISPR-associated protein Cas7/Cse4/CasC [Chromatiales bacterium]
MEFNKARFLQLHILTAYPPSNLNRDDLGRPKTAMLGGANRLRISSQSLKRAWRSSEVFEAAVGESKGVRTKEMGVRIAADLQYAGVAEKKAREWARNIAACFGKLKQEKKDDGSEEGLHIEQLAHFSPEEQQAIASLVKMLAERDGPPEESELQLLRKQIKSADIALFGRMLASNPSYNMEAAAQVAHAITVNKAAVEDDFFSAVDDLNTGLEDVGAGHLGETEFGSGLFYLYVCVDRALLLENLQGDEDLWRRTLQALVECASTIAPTGKQNSFASRARAHFVLAELGNQQPRGLSGAYMEPVWKQDMIGDAVDRLMDEESGLVHRMDQAYGNCADRRCVMNLLKGQGSLAEIQHCAVE